MINNLNNNININQNRNMEMKNMQTFNFLNQDHMNKKGNLEINDNIDINGNEKHMINIFIKTTTGLKANIICNSDSTLEINFKKIFNWR